MLKIMEELCAMEDPEKARVLSGFFKTGKGQYGEGDRFLGIPVPLTRAVAKRHRDLGFGEIKKLLKSRFHEHRLAGLLILVEKFRRGDAGQKRKVYEFYVRNSRCANNWDLVDLSADKIAGEYLLGRDKSILYRLARSENLWDRRIAIISTFAFIRRGRFADTLKIAGMLLEDRHDLIQKAVGWMLREVGKRDQEEEERFLKKHLRRIPRTTLRYAIERFDQNKKKFYLGP
jgi:3-methyladenine DNA glycosylase AlkD